jgi:hypothetical protein
MPTCFVIQPFDSGKFDKRYQETIALAIIEAGFQPHRVDEDRRADVLITSIKDGIRSASVCLADVTLTEPLLASCMGPSASDPPSALMATRMPDGTPQKTAVKPICDSVGIGIRNEDCSIDHLSGHLCRQRIEASGCQ